MDYKFLHKVVDQLVYETTIDYENDRIFTPLSSPSSFLKHCKEVYGLNEQEIEYVWKEYRDIINDKIGNNG